MKITVTQPNLAHALGAISRAVASKSTLPVLQNVLLATENGRLRLSATNLEMGITAWIGAKIETEGAVTLPARTLADLVSTLPADMVSLELNPKTQTVAIEAGKSRSNIKGMDYQEFPPMPSPDLANGIAIPASDLKELVKKVTFAASTDESRPILTGVLFTLKDRKLTASAADGFRLSVASVDLGQDVAPFSAVIPARALNELARLSDSTVTLVLDKAKAVFHTANLQIASQLIEGSFPDLAQVIPTKFGTTVKAGTAQLVKACKQAEIFAREGSGIARLKITPGAEFGAPGKLEVSATSKETGSNQAELEAKIDGAGLEIAFNVRFMLEALNAMGPNVELGLNSSTHPGRFSDPENQAFTHVIMPMHIG